MTDAPAVPDATATLTTGARMPLLGFGTWQIKGEDAVRATSAALETGYRHLDTATIYGNEAEVARTASSPLICHVPKPSSGIRAPLVSVAVASGTAGASVIRRC